MTPRLFHLLATVLGVFGIMMASTSSGEQPNVIVVMTDDQGYGDLSCHGNPILETPNIDKLYAESVRMTDFHVSPFCTPTRAALMTGRYPGRTGAYRTSSGRTLMHTDERTIANIFSDAGYVTGMVGKWHLGDNAPHRPQDRGFQDVVWHRCGGVGQASDHWGNDYFDDTYERNGQFEKFEGYCTDVWFRESLRFIEQNRTKPFFLYLATNAPHGPYRVDPKWAAPYQDKAKWGNGANFYGMIANFDHNLGELRRKLDELDLADNTILIYMTDNGTAAGGKFQTLDSEAIEGFNAGMRGKKSSVYDGGHRVPFFIHWPAAKLRGGRDVKSLAAHIDVMPTLAELCDVDIPANHHSDGISFAKQLTDTNAPADRDHVIVQFQGGAYFHHAPQPWADTCIIQKNWRLINRDELYDISTDPAQQNNVATNHPAVVKQMRDLYQPFWDSVSPRMSPVRIDIGNPTDNPTVLCSQDWYMQSGNPPWNFGSISKLPKTTGPWMVNVKTAGRYRLTLRQLPKEANAVLKAVRAKVVIAGHETSVEVESGSKAAVIELDLPAGPTELLTYLYDENDKFGGAYFTEVERLTSEIATVGKPYDGSWKSLQKMPVPAWFDDGKIGVFIHWGPYSVIGYRQGGRGYAEHVPKQLYSAQDHYYPYMQNRWGATPPEFGYKDIIPEFKAENWDPDAWAKLFADVGFRYCVMTAEHHDGWANWDSDLTPWNAVDKGPKRDLVGDLGKALTKQGLKFAPSYHRERHASFFGKKLYMVNVEPQDDIAEEIRRVPEAASLYGPFGIDKEFVDDYVARWKEIQTKYKPDFLWIDDIPIWTRDGNQVLAGQAKPEVQYFYDQCRLMITDFMNDGAARGAEVYVNNKGGNRNWPAGVGCLEKDNLKLHVIGPKWESCTTFGTSFGYLEGDKYKTIESVIHEMVEVISRNGNFLVNIGPKADGTIPEPQMERLMAMKSWLTVNGPAIYGSRYWKDSEQQDEHLAFTTNGKKLYAIKLKEPKAPFVITGTAGWDSEKIESVRLLGSDASVVSQMTSAGLRITPPADLGHSDHAWTFEIMTDEDQHHPNVIVHDADSALEGTKAVDLEGRDATSAQTHPPLKPYVIPGASVIIENAPSPAEFRKLPVPGASNRTVTASPQTSNDPLDSLTDGKVAAGIGPVFKNGIHHGIYKMDLGAAKPVSAISAWSYNRARVRGAQKLTLYGSDSVKDPGWDLSQLTPLGTVDTGKSTTDYTATSLRAAEDESLGKFRWIVWAVSPVTSTGGGENTAFQELNVAVQDPTTNE
ncbi:alpha-L-fucosidase [Rubripirellula reticaptiva]|uniref:alpha-L-fucosidase n=1 Tax=Rubripirellula reticaptiva TaxID=2528013 RepID=A0A5C6EB99_9BACT|nr:alpha-L-fucosidase [Rubripirellula reticaptiva]TWU47023.1 Arylsulfatase precursor [Rubripirellula reticaptiva]